MSVLDSIIEGVKEDSNRTSAFKQIGNAVPPLLAKTLGEMFVNISIKYKKSQEY